MTPTVTPSHTFLYDTVQDGIWYVVRPKSGLGARAIPSAVKIIESYNDRLKRTNQPSLDSIDPDSPDYITAYAPRYRYKVSTGVYRDRYVFPDLFFLHASPSTIKQFMHDNPYQVFYIHDRSRNPDTNKDELGNPTNDDYMRVSSRALADLFLSLGAYSEDIRIFTAHELQQLKYTRQVLIVDGPLAGRTCRIKSIEGKNRVIVDLLEGNLSLVLVMPDTHFQRL